ncbi:uncharacterized protein LOC108147417 [Drosophila elegans]|uniref:uncharacterized protein LOC108147417 n=1 Tax=Drosophila elegans TaxID=30023 RepID=UPI0007E6AB75|nr:uncharacterized protein LOC108147417 [Drosophila elegans]
MKRACGSDVPIIKKMVSDELEDSNAKNEPWPSTENGEPVKQDVVSAPIPGGTDDAAMALISNISSELAAPMAAPNPFIELAAIDGEKSVQERQDSVLASISVFSDNQLRAAIDETLQAPCSFGKPDAIDGKNSVQEDQNSVLASTSVAIEDPISSLDPSVEIFADEDRIQSSDPDSLAVDTSGISMTFMNESEDNSSDVSELGHQMDSSGELSVDTSKEIGKGSEKSTDWNLDMNRQLRQCLVPKDAPMVLNELKGVIISRIANKRYHDGQFTTHLTVNSKQYFGEGPSVAFAKKRACEKALRGIIIDKLTAMQHNANEIEEDDMPMIELASFALYKLFKEWKMEGFHVPEQSDERSELPFGWKTMHPGVVLSHLRPNSIYEYLGCTGKTPNEVFEMGIVVDGQEYKAKGTSKKNARHNLAALVCNTICKTNFSNGD